MKDTREDLILYAVDNAMIAINEIDNPTSVQYVEIRTIAVDKVIEIIKPKCENCRFSDIEDSGLGPCRKSAPVQTSGDGARYPSVHKSHWCGDHQDV